MSGTEDERIDYTESHERIETSKCRRNMSVGYKKIYRAVKENKLTVARGTRRGISAE